MLIKIDRSSIRKNPNAGQTIHYRPLGQPITRTIVEYINDVEVSREVTKTQSHERVVSLTPSPKYLFSYENTIIHCDECSHEYTQHELEYDYDSGIESCPNCGNTLDIGYERLTESIINEAQNVRTSIIQN
jgi:hypothetical protein